MKSNAFYDTHCHALSLAHPSFLAFAQAQKHNGLKNVFAQMASFNYLASSLLFKVGERMRNMLSVMERDVCSIFELMEDDLAGRFAEQGEGKSLLSGGKLRLGKADFDRLVICPLIIDFEGAISAQQVGTYYDRPSAKPVAIQIRDVLEGIQDYRRARPKGFLEIRPFLGVDPRHYSAQELAAALEEAFDGYEKGEEASHAAFVAMVNYDAKSPVQGRFAGLKVYPPLGFDPWPDKGPEREKVELLWSFCESRNIPVVTHCDDQGFRVASIEEAWVYSSPARWEPVFRAYPALRLDFAHFGAQYSRSLGHAASTEWTDRIVRLMVDFPNVYADFSFDGTDSEYFRWLNAYIGRRSSALSALIQERLFFGTDFLVNLSKVRCYSDCFKVYSKAPFPDELKRRFGHDNPEKFLFG